jgi:2,3-bisphosphoglycerate-dependent phosphoglycerate mutase
MQSILVLLRHGQSEWNRSNIFTGWADVSLSAQGEEEARHAALELKNYKFDAIYVSALKRAQETAWIVRNQEPICSKALNERSYGDLEGKNKDTMRKVYGEEQIKIWRRSFLSRPPNGESLKDTCDRVLPYFKSEIEPRLLRGETILICAHGNSLRALIKYLEDLTDEEVVDLEIPTGKPIVYYLDNNRIVKKILL